MERIFAKFNTSIRQRLSDNEKIKTDKIFKFDFHGFSIDEANQKIKEIIETCHNKGISQILHHNW